MLAKIHTPQARVARPSARRHAVVVRAATTTEMPRWPVMFQELTKAKLETISPQEAKARVDSGASSILQAIGGHLYSNGTPLEAYNITGVPRM